MYLQFFVTVCSLILDLRIYQLIHLAYSIVLLFSFVVARRRVSQRRQTRGPARAPVNEEGHRGMFGFIGLVFLVFVYGYLLLDR